MPFARYLRLTADVLVDLIEFLRREHKLVANKEVRRVSVEHFDGAALSETWPKR